MDGRPRACRPVGHSLSLIIPAYNEAAGIGAAIAEADTALAALGTPYEILVVDDGSTDGTAAAAADAARGRPNVRILRHGENRGYGAALHTGFAAARHDRVAFTDADCQFHLADLGSLLCLTDRHALAVGYRVGRQDPWPRRFFSWGYNVLTRALLGTGVRDCDCALKVFRRDALGRLMPQAAGFFVNTEMLTRARLLHLDVAEVAVRHRPRRHGTSKVSLREIPRTLVNLLPFWWSQVLFAGGPTKPAGDGPSRLGGFAAALLLVVVAGLLFFTRLSCPLLEPEEARYAEIPREMLAEGSLVEPVWHGAPYYQKPPLLYWLVMGSYAVCGVYDWAARLVPATAAVLTVLVTFWWGKRTVGLGAGLAGALLLCLSARFVYLGRLLTMDGLLCLWVVTALATAHVAMAGGKLRWGWWLLSAFACGLGLLTKGPVALVLVAVPVLGQQALDHRSAAPAWRPWLAYAAVAVGLAGPWFVAMAVRNPEAAGAFFWVHNVRRFLDPVDHAKPLWFYLPGLLVGMLPWTLLLVPLARFLARRSARTAARRPAALGVFLLALLWCLGFYSLAGCKRAGYILPALPPLALLLGTYLAATLPRLRLALEGMLQRGRRRAVPAAWGALAAAVFLLLLTGVHQWLPGYHRRFALRGQVRVHQWLAADRRLPVACYPHGWDSVSFYLRRNDVRVYTPARRAQLIADLGARPRTLVFVKSAHYVEDLVRSLPPSLEFVPYPRQGPIVTSGLVRRRVGLPEDVVAQTDPFPAGSVSDGH
jgi:dolichol-phosphate mannosyltransferase